MIQDPGSQAQQQISCGLLRIGKGLALLFAGEPSGLLFQLGEPLRSGCPDHQVVAALLHRLLWLPHGSQKRSSYLAGRWLARRTDLHQQRPPAAEFAGVKPASLVAL